MPRLCASSIEIRLARMAFASSRMSARRPAAAAGGQRALANSEKLLCAWWRYKNAGRLDGGDRMALRLNPRRKNSTGWLIPLL